jgi:hypothetical protein
MSLVDVNDNPNEGYAYNVWHCLTCANICKENVWDYKGYIWIDKANNVSHNLVKDDKDLSDN